jgi:small subunit ribosomal protein S13
MARIAGIDLQNNQRIDFALTSIYGVGPKLAKKIVEATKIVPETRVSKLTEAEISKLQKEIENYPIEGDLRRLVTQSIRRLEEIGSYRGIRHKRGLPARGQRTRSNARTKRGKRQTVGAMKKDLRAQMTQKGQSRQAE